LDKSKENLHDYKGMEKVNELEERLPRKRKLNWKKMKGNGSKGLPPTSAKNLNAENH